MHQSIRRPRSGRPLHLYWMDGWMDVCLLHMMHERMKTYEPKAATPTLHCTTHIHTMVRRRTKGDTHTHTLSINYLDGGEKVGVLCRNVYSSVWYAKIANIGKMTLRFTCWIDWLMPAERTFSLYSLAAEHDLDRSLRIMKHPSSSNHTACPITTTTLPTMPPTPERSLWLWFRLVRMHAHLFVWRYN